MTSRFFWRVQLTVWPLYGLVHYLAAIPAITPEERWHMAGIKAIRAATGLIVSSPLPLLYAPMLRRRARPAVVIGVSALVVGFGLGNLWLVLDRTLLAIVRSFTPLQVNWARFPHGYDLDYSFVLLVWVGAYVSLWHLTDAAERREEALRQGVAAREAKLEALTYQVSPHFLFNTLNALRSVIAEDQERAREMVTRLASFLRYSLSSGTETSVAEEAEMARAYLAIEQARFERGLESSLDVDPAALTCVVPALVLQPLLENALKHGVAVPSGARRVRLSARLEGNRLLLEVANTGALGAGSGIGLRNTRERLAHLYGDRQSLSLVEEDGWVRARVEIEDPRHVEPARADR